MRSNKINKNILTNEQLKNKKFLQSVALKENKKKKRNNKKKI